ncbi:Fanconi anemia group A protein isoform X2 [Spea bombifrons]|uniref:Fanconi anemia group A protein isoform X2 n=1 Tax=Spea bombifrons TaxID=233779 RepID=UPI00234BC976|nr:Fanconi anemia group A protein isoform X2 [Spea bombifrons]
MSEAARGGKAMKQGRKAPDTYKSLQEAALYLLSCNQDPSDFLSEVAAPPYKKPCSNESSHPSKTQKTSMHETTFVASVLRDQAVQLGLPVGILTTRAAVSNVQRICQESVERAGAVLSENQREKLTCLLKTLKGLLAENCFCRPLFSRDIWELQHPPVLEAVWHLHKEDIVQLDDLLNSCKDPSSAVDWFCGQMRSLCSHMENSPDDSDRLEQIISDFLVVLVENAYSPSTDAGKNSEPLRITEISLAILDKMLSWVLDAVSDGKSDQSYKPRVERHWLVTYEVSRYRSRLIPESLENFFIHTLSRVLTFKPQLKVSDAIRFQGDWSFVKTCPLLTDLYRRLFVLLHAEKLTSHIQLVLETQEVNWHHVLSCISCLVICREEAQQLVKNLLDHLLTQAFTGYELECLITAFLIARQAALEGPAAFVSYTEWFKCTFGAATSYHSTSKKSLVFLLKLLSDLVPYEAPQYLKVHVLHPPFMLAKYRPLLMEYITLAKTRLADMKVSIEDMGLYEDLSSGPDKAQPQIQALQDVEKAVQIFENTGKIPASVMEASIFRKPYFTSRFLPALLAPRVLPAAPDSQMMLIDALKRADKIPATLFTSYTEACEQEKQRKLEGRNTMVVTVQEEPLGRLKTALWDLRPLVTEPNRYSDVAAQLAFISDRLSAVIGSGYTEDTGVIAETLIPSALDVLEVQDQTVADLILTCFCQCVMAASRTNPPHRQGPWPSLYVRMLCGHRRALSVVLRRILQLLCCQSPRLRDPHVVGLAAFSIHLHECQTSLPAPNTGANCLDRFWDVILNPRCSNAMLVCLRFCVAAASYAFCRFSVLRADTSTDCIPPRFLHKLQHLVPRLVSETRGEASTESETDTSLIWSSLSHPLASWKEAVLTLWSQSCLQEVLRQPLFKLSFQDWLLWEMASDPGSDALRDAERQDYQRWAVNQSYLPEVSDAGGCGGSLETACTIIVDAALEFNRGSSLGCSSQENVSHSRTGLADILCRLQELVCDMMTVGDARSARVSHSSFLFKTFHRRLAAKSGNPEVGARLARQMELDMCCRILLGLPSLLLISTNSVRGITRLSAKDFFTFVNEEWKNLGPRGCALPYNITAHFFKGLLTSCTQCDDPSEAINSLVTESSSACPVLLTSAALWWPRLYPVLRCHWDRLFTGRLPKEIEILQELQTTVDRCVCDRLPLPLSCAPWLSAAFVHFTMQRKKLAHDIVPVCLAASDSKAAQLLVSVLFFSIMDLIPALLKDGSEQKISQKTCLQIIQCLEERGESWLSVFRMAEGCKQTDLSLLHRTSSDEFIRLLPFAFYSLLPSLQVGNVIKQQGFLEVAVQMYIQLLQLFLDANPFAASSLDSVQLHYHDLISQGRSFLLSSITKCPKPSNTLKNQIMPLCAEYDPELHAMLASLHAPPDYGELDKEPDLF